MKKCLNDSEDENKTKLLEHFSQGVSLNDSEDENKTKLLEQFSQGVYVGETSRVWRSGIKEHVTNAWLWRSDSFILDH